MSVVEQGASFDISSDYVEASQAFTLIKEIVVYVEGYEDKSFWRKRFENKGIVVTVKSYCQEGIANGKGTLLAGIRDGSIILGAYLVVALDSDYDYLLDKNTDVLNRETVFQTYSYSIENIMWNPEVIDDVCKVSSCCDEYFPDGRLKDGILNWSCTIYPLFLTYLKSGASDATLFSSIIDSFSLEENLIDYKGPVVTDFLDTDFIDYMKAKGLVPNNAYLFIRGHDYADTLEKHCKQLNYLALQNEKLELEASGIKNPGQFAGELKNKQCEPSGIIRGKDAICALCIPKIESDFDKFMAKYH